MKKLISILLLIIISYQCNAQSTETNLYLREELVKQRDDLLRKARELQARIDAIDRKLGSKNEPNKQYLTKTVKYNKKSNYSNSLNGHATKKKKYRSSSSRTYHRGPRGGCYYINSNGNKTYVARSKCN